ncbi:MAG TPA: DUF4178 domain-containing protein [Methylomirabilota bacterium]|nr:DUF4178 domain-containing protein [Methylomirabilota bacterium]
MALSPTARPEVKALACRGCGASLTVRAPGRSVTVVCGACGAVLDAQDPDAAVIATYAQRTQVTPLIPLGRRGALKGETFEVIGFMLRQTVVEGLPYTWGEYLLYNPSLGFRWLTEYAGHWTLTKTASANPRKHADSATVTYLGTRFHHFQTSIAEVRYVIGEFPWQVRVGETADVTDYVAPPLMLSSETTERETTWSVGEHVDGARVWKAFALEGLPPVARGVGAVQPSPFDAHVSNVLWFFIGFAALAALVQVAFGILSQQRMVFERGYQYDPRAAANAVVTDSFPLTGRRSNVVIDLETSLDNNWAYFHMALVNQDTGTAKTFGREVSFYRGRDSDGDWSEGSAADRVTLPSVAAGTYYLLIEPEPRAQRMRYVVRVWRDVPRLRYFWLALVLLVIPPLIFWYRRHSFEYRRWEESDHPKRTLVTSSSDDDDD